MSGRLKNITRENRKAFQLKNVGGRYIDRQRFYRGKAIRVKNYLLVGCEMIHLETNTLTIFCRLHYIKYFYILL